LRELLAAVIRDGLDGAPHQILEKVKARYPNSEDGEKPQLKERHERGHCIDEPGSDLRQA
jgi:hypothetical protein